MELVPVKYERHIFVCVNERDEKQTDVLRTSCTSCCANRNSKSKCLGHCAFGPTIAVYPDGFMFKNAYIEEN